MTQEQLNALKPYQKDSYLLLSEIRKELKTTSNQSAAAFLSFINSHFISIDDNFDLITQKFHKVIDMADNFNTLFKYTRELIIDDFIPSETIEIVAYDSDYEFWSDMNEGDFFLSVLPSFEYQGTPFQCLRRIYAELTDLDYID